MDDTIHISRSALEEALFNHAMSTVPGTALEKARSAITFANGVIAALEPGIAAAARSDRARNAALARYNPPVAPHPLQNEPQAAIPPAPLPTEPPKRRGRPPRADPAPVAAPAAPQPPLEIPDSGLAPAPFGQGFAPTPMPQAPVMPPAPIPPIVVEHPTPPPHPFGVR